MIEPKHAETAKVMNEKRIGEGEGKPDENKMRDEIDKNREGKDRA